MIIAAQGCLRILILFNNWHILVNCIACLLFFCLVCLTVTRLFVCLTVTRLFVCLNITRLVYAYVYANKEIYWIDVNVLLQLFLANQYYIIIKKLTYNWFFVFFFQRDNILIIYYLSIQTFDKNMYYLVSNLERKLFLTRLHYTQHCLMKY